MNAIGIIVRTAPVGTTGRALRLAAQFILLVAISKFVELTVTALHLPLPSNAVGMLVLFLMLQYGLLRLETINVVSSLLVRHLAFFFIPIAVGLMAYQELLATTGLAILLVIASSTLVGMLVAGLVAQLLKGLRR